MSSSQTYDARLGRYRTGWDNLMARVGEMGSMLRTTGQRIILGTGAGAWDSGKLDTSKVDYELARGLYDNTLDKYKLGAGFSKAVINTAVGFMGVPRFSHGDGDADAAMELFFGKKEGRLLRLNRNTMRDGDAYARLWLAADAYSGADEFQLGMVPPEWVEIINDPLTGAIMQAVIVHRAQWKDLKNGVVQHYQVVETITRTKRSQEVVGFAPQEIKDALTLVQVNPWGFVPLVRFRNEGEEYATSGKSDLEPLEPYLKAYHDVMLACVMGVPLFTRPKAMLAVTNVDSFLKTNFSEAEISAGKLSFAGKELFVMNQGDKAAFISGDSGLAGATTLLQFLFYKVVDTSETPEFAFGTAVASSKASTETQMPILAKRIRRKQGGFTEPYNELGAMFLAMRARHENKRLESYTTDMEWGEVNQRDDAAVATTIKDLVEGLTNGMENGLISQPAAVEFAREFIPTMLPYIAPEGATEGERERIAKTLAGLQRMKDTAGQVGALDDDKTDDTKPGQ